MAKEETRAKQERRQKYCMTAFLVFVFLTALANAAASTYLIANYITLIGIVVSGICLVFAVRN
jgi:heme/copper-type cytochrome/quinol oxidase subunit 4